MTVALIALGLPTAVVVIVLVGILEPLIQPRSTTCKTRSTSPGPNNR